MRRALVAISIGVSFSLCAFAAVAKPKVPFYRNRAVPAIVPRAVGNGVAVNAASFEPGLSPGELATVVGTDLTSVSGTVVASSLPLPTRLAGVTVLISGVPAPLYSISFANGQDQISFQVPWGIPTGPQAAQVQVFDGDLQTTSFMTDCFTSDPGIFVYQGLYAVAVHGSDGTLIGPNSPAAPGEVVVLYTTGLGPLDTSLGDGAPGPSDPPARTIDPFQVLVDGEDSPVFFSGLAPQFVGLYQVNFRVPFDAASGNLTLKIQSPHGESRTATLPVD